MSGSQSGIHIPLSQIAGLQSGNQGCGTQSLNKRRSNFVSGSRLERHGQAGCHRRIENQFRCAFIQQQAIPRRHRYDSQAQARNAVTEIGDLRLHQVHDLSRRVEAGDVDQRIVGNAVQVSVYKERILVKFKRRPNHDIVDQATRCCGDKPTNCEGLTIRDCRTTQGIHIQQNIIVDLNDRVTRCRHSIRIQLEGHDA